MALDGTFAWNTIVDGSAGDNNDSQSVRDSIEMEIYEISHFH